MKNLALVAVLATLAACQQQEAAPAPEASAEATAAAAPAATGALAADGKPSAGKFEITTHDGKVFTEEVKADGTYLQTDATGKVVKTGKWEQKSPTQYCTTADEAGVKQECRTEGVDAKGVWTSTDPEGNTGTVKRLEG